MDEQERTRQDWGGFRPETQKALRFVAQNDIGAAKQVSTAISHEYAPVKAQQGRTKQKSAAARHQELTEDDFRAMIDRWEAAHPQVKLTDRQRENMLRTQLFIQKHMPGWTF